MTACNARSDEEWEWWSEDEVRRIKEYEMFIEVNVRVNEYSKLVISVVRAVCLVALHTKIQQRKLEEI